MEHVSSRTTYLSVADVVGAIIALHREATRTSDGQARPDAMQDITDECHLRVADALEDSLADQDQCTRTFQMQYTSLREFEADLLIDDHERGIAHRKVITFSKAQKLFEHLASGADPDSIVDYLESCAKLEESAAKRISSAQQPNDAYSVAP